MKSHDAEWLLARAQVGGFFVLLIGFLVILGILIVHYMEMSTTQVTLVTSSLGVLGTVLALAANFMFARTRPHALPDPGTTTVTTSPPPDGATATNVQTTVTASPPTVNPP